MSCCSDIHHYSVGTNKLRDELGFTGRIKMEAGITLWLPVGSHADALTYLLQVEWASLEKNKQTEYKQVGHVLSHFLLRFFWDAERTRC